MALWPCEPAMMRSACHSFAYSEMALRGKFLDHAFRRWRGGMDRFLLGSVSEAVAIHAQCSVEVIRK